MTFHQNVNFPGLKIKFPDLEELFFVTVHFLTCSNHAKYTIMLLDSNTR